MKYARRTVLVNIVFTSLLMVSWQMYSSVSMTILLSNTYLQEDANRTALRPVSTRRALEALELQETNVYARPRDTVDFVKADNHPPATKGLMNDVHGVAKKNSDAAITDALFSRYSFVPPTTPFQQPISECGSGPEFSSFFELKPKFRSRFDEDRIIYEKFFEGKLNGRGTYIELGAFDGSTESNTRFYDMCLGWKGLLIEGNPGTYQKTVAARPQAHRMSFAPSCKADSTVQFYKYPMANSGLEGKAKTYEGKPTVEVPCGPLGPVLEEVFQGERINFFSLDVEGAEPMVLETIDFAKVRIDVLMIEVENTYCKEDCKSRDRSRAIMDKAGYKRYPSGDVVRASDVYVHPDSPYYPA